MAIGLLGVRTSGVSSGSAGFEIIAPPVGGCFLLSMRISLAAATASTFGLGRPAAKGVTPTTPAKVLNPGGSDANVLDTLTALAWGTPPTTPGAFYRRVTMPAVIGSDVVWTFSAAGIYIPPGETLVVWNLAANGVSDIEIEIKEL